MWLVLVGFMWVFSVGFLVVWLDSWWVIMLDRFRFLSWVIVLVIFWLYMLWNILFLLGNSELLKLVLCMFLISICVNWFFSWCVILLIFVGLFCCVGCRLNVGLMCMLDYFEFGI